MLEGICVALVTPYDKEQRIDCGALRDLVGMNVQDGVDGFFITGTTSEMMLLTKNERIQILRTAVRAAEGTGKYLIAHIAMNNYEDTLELGQCAKDLGVDAVALIPPLYYHYGPNELVEYYRYFADRLKIPYFIYDIPCNTGIELMSAQNRKIFDLEYCIGAKASHKDLYRIDYLLRNHPNHKIFIGADEILLGALAMGVCGGIGSTYNVAGKEFRKIFEKFRTGDMAGAQEIQKTCNVLVDAIISFGGIPVVKYLLKLRGLDVGECRAPMRKLTEEEKAKIRDIYAEFLEKSKNF